MEEVWNDLSLSSSIYHHHYNSSSAAAAFLDHHHHPPLTTALSLSTGGAHFTSTVTKKRASSETDNISNSNCKHNNKNIGEDDAERHKRLMKNRESADRSRARKQAYTIELEKEVERLKKENATLKRQLKTFCSEGYAQMPKKHTLQRTLTAPF